MLAVAAALLAVAVLLATAAIALAADPSPSSGRGDVRTTPAAPGIVGDPLFALGGVAVIGLLAVGVTLLAVRVAGRR